MIVSVKILESIIRRRFPDYNDERIEFMMNDIHDQCGHFENLDENFIILGGSENELLSTDAI